ncbi:16S rRNA (cytosine(1402)-N(4))-methyltransferase RsmH [Sphaerotilus mobilis]|uniref:Ribosomal RNA small subunit methyltransferase H n=1 Tax=Sphaerotilus mobilis TaxID=47994 RepID=A0A4Q7M9B5_9BURK|nr:16S rRNA (cytosine(1402)-N(4))-methyltransferase RsmH [Sphaerotilus mobilis]RZS63308.1 16S rRNA (cytosine1402-N4)-methyltransferase [Sphaerotilus mobilis]
MATAVAVPGQHRTVLLHEAVDALVQQRAGVYVDGTYGRGGHSRLILSQLDADGRLIAIDRDPEAIANARDGETRIDDPRFSIHHSRYAAFDELLDELGIAQVDGLLLDIGVSSPQIDDPDRGFSFRFDGPLDMRMDPTRGQSAAEFIATASQERLIEVIRDYGEERFAPALARALLARRAEGRSPTRTGELAALCASVVKTRERGQDPATRTFQALRIAVNGELDELERALAQSLKRLKPGGRLVVISFHSLEDRIVKTFIARHAQEVYDRRVPHATGTPLALKAIARIKPGDDEVAVNPRARSAILRVAERTDAALPQEWRR